MLRPAISAKCCHEYEKLPDNVDCFLKDICAELNKLDRRHHRMLTRRKRILQLARPNHRTMPFKSKCACKFRKPVEIVRLEHPMHTRTEQLAYPPVRKLLLFKNDMRAMFPDQRMAIINRLIRQSLLSVYSRLTNVQPPQKKLRIPKWDETEWKKHKKYFSKLAKPKRIQKAPKTPVKRMPLGEMKRFKFLAKPKSRLELDKLDWTFTPGMKNYTLTERMAKLAKPKIRDDTLYNQSVPNKIPSNALLYKATPRITELSQPAVKRSAKSDLKDDPFGIPKNALRAKCSPRLEELAEPREYENVHLRPHPSLISPAALKAKASPRILELAKHKGS